MRNVAIAAIVACALPLAAFAEDIVMPKMLKGIGKGQWRMEMLENSQMKPGQKPPVMTMCTDNFMKEAKEREAHAKGDRQCKQRLLKDGSDEAVVESKCPDRTITTTLKRENANSVLAEMNSTGGDRPMHVKMRYTHLGACREGQPTMTLDKDSEQCQKIRAAMGRMDPAKSCANAGANREQCEQAMRQRITQMKAMCSG